MKKPTWLKKMKLNSVDFVRRGANPAADIALFKSADYDPELDGEYIAKAEDVLPSLTDTLGESFSSIAKDHSLDDAEKVEMIHKSMCEFIDTVDDYLSSLGILEKSFDDDDDLEDFQTAESKVNLRKGVKTEMSKFKFENVDKSLLTPEEARTLEALIAKAHGETEEFDKENIPAGKVNPAKAKEEMEKEDDLPPAVKKALEEVAELKKSYEMRELESVAKKYEEVLGKKASETAQTLYDLKKSGESNYNAYIAAMDAQVEMKKGLFEEIGKSGNYNGVPVAKSEPENKIETIAKSYRDSDPTMSYEESLAKAWENNPDLVAAYEETAGF